MIETGKIHSQAVLGRPINITKKEVILNSARQEFFEKGFANAAIESIAKHAMVSKVTIYSHFKTKKALFSLIIKRECDSLNNNFFSNAERHLDLHSKLTFFGFEVARYISNERVLNLECLLAAELKNNTDLGLLYLKSGPHRMKKYLYQILLSADKAGELSIKNIHDSAEFFIGAVKGTEDWEIRFSPERSSKKLTSERTKRIENIVEIFLSRYSN